MFLEPSPVFVEARSTPLSMKKSPEKVAFAPIVRMPGPLFTNVPAPVSAVLSVSRPSGSATRTVAFPEPMTTVRFEEKVPPV